MTENSRKNLKDKVVKELTENPIVEAACRKSGLPRATYYRWLEDDDEFYHSAELAQAQGRDRVNDMAESEILKGIGRGDFRFVKYWLSHNHRRYVQKLPAKRPFREFLRRLPPGNDTW